jgi:hypothetical protein
MKHKYSPELVRFLGRYEKSLKGLEADMIEIFDDKFPDPPEALAAAFVQIYGERCAAYVRIASYFTGNKPKMETYLSIAIGHWRQTRNTIKNLMEMIDGH